MERIVTKPLKVDLHIHSCFSKYKDEFDIVKDGTEDNLPLLFSKLCEYEVNVAAITDHDYFSFSLYQSFKKLEGHGTLLKVFPGVEFSVGIKGDDNTVKCIHVIAIFDDSNIDKVKRIESVLELKNGKINYENGINLYFTEEKFISKLRDINLDVVLIAHQKGSVTAKKASKNDLKSLGDKTFDEFLQSSVFEALEFKSMRNGLFNNLFAKEKNASYDVVRFITGSDCHTWSCYPKHDLKLSEDGFHHTFLKCLPTFKGLCMALTDYTRISLSNSLFSNDDSALDKIELEENGKRFSIPLSKGLNAIIGDNSIGKSLLIHKLTAYSELSDNKIKDGYERYLEKNSFQILNSVEKDDIYHFDGQGTIRKRFESKDEKENQSFLQNKFPEPPLPDAYKSIINEQFRRIFEAIEAKFLFDSKLKQLKTLAMVNVDVKRKNLAASTLLYKKSKYDGYARLKKYFEGIITKIGCPDSKVNDGLEQVDLVTLNHIKSELESLKQKYTKCLNEEKRVFNIKTGIKNGVDNYNSEIKLYKDSLEEKNDCFASDSEEMAQIISELVLLKRKIRKEDFTIAEPIKVESAELIYGDYKFVRRFRNVNLISNEYLNSVLKRALKSSFCLDTSKVTEDELSVAIKYTDKMSLKGKALENFKTVISSIVDSDFFVESVILKAEQDVFDNLSNGLNATLYFDIISHDKQKGIYIVDQPEDDVSQPAIKSNLISDFKKMSSLRQVILITHNAQFVVNLDVDNVICLSKDKNKGIEIKYGALEYEDANTNIIRTVADNLDGGVDSIKKRWKRYGKEIDFR